MRAGRTMCGSTSAASQHAPAGQFGDSGVGILHGPGYWNVGPRPEQGLHFGDGRTLTFKIEAFNVFNHPNFALQARAPRTSQPDDFGRILNTFSAPRIVELVLKFTY